MCFKNALGCEPLAAVQAAWERCEAPARAAWLEARSHGLGIGTGGGAVHNFGRADGGSAETTRKWFGLDDSHRPKHNKQLLAMDSAFLKVVHNETAESDEVWRVAERVLESRWEEDGSAITCTSVIPRTYLSDADREGYTRWHRDGQRQAPQLKMFLYLSDVEVDGGPLALVPGSHQLPLGPQETLRCSFRSSMTLDADLPQSAMPNAFRFAAKAGSAVLFDLASWHTAMENVPGRPDRRTVIIGWGPRSSRWAEHEAQLEAAGPMGPTLRKLLALS